MRAWKSSLNKCRSKITQAAVFLLTPLDMFSRLTTPRPCNTESKEQGHPFDSNRCTRVKLRNYAPLCSRSMISSMGEASVVNRVRHVRGHQHQGLRS